MEEISKKRAVALSYDQEKDDAPRVVAKGKGHLAQMIEDIALSNDIPLQKNPQLADYLMALDLYQEIPPEIYPVVAEVLAFIYRMDRKMGG